MKSLSHKIQVFNKSELEKAILKATWNDELSIPKQKHYKKCQEIFQGKCSIDNYAVLMNYIKHISLKKWVYSAKILSIVQTCICNATTVDLCDYIHHDINELKKLRQDLLKNAVKPPPNQDQFQYLISQLLYYYFKYIMKFARHAKIFILKYANNLIQTNVQHNDEMKWEQQLYQKLGDMQIQIKIIDIIVYIFDKILQYLLVPKYSDKYQFLKIITIYLFEDLSKQYLKCKMFCQENVFQIFNYSKNILLVQKLYQFYCDFIKITKNIQKIEFVVNMCKPHKPNILKLDFYVINVDKNKEIEIFVNKCKIQHQEYLNNPENNPNIINSLKDNQKVKQNIGDFQQDLSRQINEQQRSQGLSYINQIESQNFHKNDNQRQITNNNKINQNSLLQTQENSKSTQNNNFFQNQEEQQCKQNKFENNIIIFKKNANQNQNDEYLEDIQDEEESNPNKKAYNQKNKPIKNGDNKINESPRSLQNQLTEQQYIQKDSNLQVRNVFTFKRKESTSSIIAQRSENACGVDEEKIIDMKFIQTEKQRPNNISDNNKQKSIPAASLLEKLNINIKKSSIEEMINLNEKQSKQQKQNNIQKNNMNGQKQRNEDGRILFHFDQQLNNILDLNNLEPSSPESIKETPKSNQKNTSRKRITPMRQAVNCQTNQSQELDDFNYNFSNSFLFQNRNHKDSLKNKNATNILIPHNSPNDTKQNFANQNSNNSNSQLAGNISFSDQNQGNIIYNSNEKDQYEDRQQDNQSKSTNNNNNNLQKSIPFNTNNNQNSNNQVYEKYPAALLSDRLQYKQTETQNINYQSAQKNSGTIKLTSKLLPQDILQSIQYAQSANSSLKKFKFGNFSRQKKNKNTNVAPLINIDTYYQSDQESSDQEQKTQKEVTKKYFSQQEDVKIGNSMIDRKQQLAENNKQQEENKIEQIKSNNLTHNDEFECPEIFSKEEEKKQINNNIQDQGKYLEITKVPVEQPELFEDFKLYQNDDQYNNVNENNQNQYNKGQNKQQKNDIKQQQQQDNFYREAIEDYGVSEQINGSSKVAASNQFQQRNDNKQVNIEDIFREESKSPISNPLINAKPSKNINLDLNQPRILKNEMKNGIQLPQEDGQRNNYPFDDEMSLNKDYRNLNSDSQQIEQTKWNKINNQQQENFQIQDNEVQQYRRDVNNEQINKNHDDLNYSSKKDQLSPLSTSNSVQNNMFFVGQKSISQNIQQSWINNNVKKPFLSSSIKSEEISPFKMEQERQRQFDNEFTNHTLKESSSTKQQIKNNNATAINLGSIQTDKNDFVQNQMYKKDNIEQGQQELKQQQNTFQHQQKEQQQQDKIDKNFSEKILKKPMRRFSRNSSASNFSYLSSQRKIDDIEIKNQLDNQEQKDQWFYGTNEQQMNILSKIGQGRKNSLISLKLGLADSNIPTTTSSYQQQPNSQFLNNTLLSAKSTNRANNLKSNRNSNNLMLRQKSSTIQSSENSQLQDNQKSSLILEEIGVKANSNIFIKRQTSQLDYINGIQQPLQANQEQNSNHSISRAEITPTSIKPRALEKDDFGRELQKIQSIKRRISFKKNEKSSILSPLADSQEEMNFTKSISSHQPKIPQIQNLKALSAATSAITSSSSNLNSTNNQSSNIRFSPFNLKQQGVNPYQDQFQSPYRQNQQYYAKERAITTSEQSTIQANANFFNSNHNYQMNQNSNRQNKQSNSNYMNNPNNQQVSEDSQKDENLKQDQYKIDLNQNCGNLLFSRSKVSNNKSTSSFINFKQEFQNYELSNILINKGKVSYNSLFSATPQHIQQNSIQKQSNQLQTSN